MARGRAWFLWGLKRSGIHFVANWLYANQGGVAKEPLGESALDHHWQLRDGFCDRAAGVLFFNNCGRKHSREFTLGSLDRADFERAMGGAAAATFGIEDCRIEPFASRILTGDHVTNVVVLRDPLNNLASRLQGQVQFPTVFPVNAEYVDLYESYCAEALGWTSFLPNKVAVVYDRFVVDRDYRDATAARLGVPNVDATSEVSHYGGGSSFTALSPVAASSVLRRFEERPPPAHLVEMRVARAAVREACTSLFGYDLAERAARLPADGPPSHPRREQRLGRLRRWRRT